MGEDTPQRAWWYKLLADPMVQGAMKLVILALLGALLALFGFASAKLHSMSQSLESTKDVATDTNQTQKAVAKGTKELIVNQIGDSAPAVKDLEATTRP